MPHYKILVLDLVNLNLFKDYYNANRKVFGFYDGGIDACENSIHFVLKLIQRIYNAYIGVIG
jgi:hypothetical protein